MTQADVASPPSARRQVRTSTRHRAHRPPTPLGDRRQVGRSSLAVVALRASSIQRLLEQGAVAGRRRRRRSWPWRSSSSTGRAAAVPLKYLVPGLLFMLALQMWPIVYTVATSFTNYGDGHRVSKQESIDRLIAKSVREVPGTPRYKLSRRGQGGRRHRDRRRRASCSPTRTAPLYVGDAKGLEDLPADGVEKTPDRQDHRGARLHDPQRPAGQRPQQDLDDLRRADSRRRRHQARSASPRRSRASRPSPTTRPPTPSPTAPPARRTSRGTPRGSQGRPGRRVSPQGWKENVGLENYTARADRPHPARRLRQDLRLEHVLRGRSRCSSTFLLGMLLALLLQRPAAAGARRSTGRC